MNDKVVIAVQFRNDKTEQYTGKLYSYLIDRKLYFEHRDSFIKYPFNLMIESGYDYRGALVQAIMVFEPLSNDFNNYKTITDFNFQKLKKRDKAREQDFLNVSSIDTASCLEETMDIKKAISVLTGENDYYNCTTAETALSSQTAVDNSYCTGLSVGGMTLGDSCSTRSIYIPKDAIPNDGIDGNITLDFVDYTNLSRTIDKIEKELEILKNNKDKNEKENINMNMFGMNVKFGAVSKSEVRMSIYGPAFKANDGWYAHNGDDYINVDGFLFGEENYCYMFPVTDATLNIGDYIYHNNGWCRVIDVDKDNRLIVEKIMTHEVVTVLPTKNLFGFEFYTKLMPLFGNTFNVSKEQPFGNMLPLLMMDNKGSNKDMLMMMMAMQGGTFDMSNSMMMMMLMMGDGNQNIYETMMLMQMMQGQPLMGKKEEK